MYQIIICYQSLIKQHNADKNKQSAQKYFKNWQGRIRRVFIRDLIQEHKKSSAHSFGDVQEVQRPELKG